jgi:hypothetical protein
VMKFTKWLKQIKLLQNIVSNCTLHVNVASLAFS